MIKTGKDLATACLDVAKNYKTLYVMGCFGWPMNDYNKKRAKAEYVYNSNKAAKIDAASADTFGFDCVNLIKALLWGWSGDVNASYGGAVYQSNGVPDINDDMMIRECKDVSTDFTTIQVGEVVWMQGHIGVYVGGGLVVECTPIWEDGVQVTVLLNKGWQQGNGRYWTSHGKLPWITYEEEKPEEQKGLMLPVLQSGSKGYSVKALQILLIGYGFSCGSYGADGDFGGGTKAAVVAFQNANKLEADGIAGNQTWSRLLGIA
jgi:hypothetical protein